MKHLLTLILFCSPFWGFSQKKVEKDFYPNGKLKSITVLQNKTISGYTEYYPNGNKKKINKYRNGFEYGEQLEYYQNGNIKTSRLIFNTRAVPHSLVSDSAIKDLYIDAVSLYEVNYSLNGKTSSEGTYLYGQKYGYWRYYNEEGTIIKDEWIEFKFKPDSD